VPVWSRRGAELASCFPDVAAAACEQLDPGTVIDGELVVWQNGRIDFTALTPRLAYRGSRRPPSGLTAASFLAFDLLAGAGVDLRNEPLRTRREHLEQVAASWRPPLQLTPQTADRDEAEQWFDNYAAADVGVEGLVVKGAAQRYVGGQRGWLKVRIRNTAEATVGAVTGSIERPHRLVLGLLDASGNLRVAGLTSELDRRQAAEVGALLVATDEHPWPAQLLSRQFGRFAKEQVVVNRVAPTVVVEVDADTAFEHGRWRHPTRFHRVRSDLANREELK
jgi:ATP-dependent DNA ligase